MSQPKPRSLILASQSPRRRELLAQAGYAFTVVLPAPTAESGVCSGEGPAQLVVRMARQKAADVAQRIDQGLIVACDTVAVCQGQVLGKPADREHARDMLERLQGSVHEVLSGLCVWRRPDDQRVTGLETTQLRMDRLTEAEIEAYLDTGGWEGKAGAFGYQDGLDWVHILSGTASNVVGLPLELLAHSLRAFDNPA